MSTVVAEERSALPHAAHALDVHSVERRLGTRLRGGLSRSEARRRLQRHGPNHLRAPETRSRWAVLRAQLQSVLIALLAAAAVLAFWFGRNVEGASILVVIALNTLLGFFTELRAVRSVEGLRRLGDVETTVRRDGLPVRVAARELVPGDVLLLEGGDRVTADARIAMASRLSVDESALTGEAVPVAKLEAAVPPDTPLAERYCMLFKGTWVTRGSCEAIVVATGYGTELGRTASLVERIEDIETPLERRLRRLGHQLLWVSVGLALLVVLSGVVAGRDPLLIAETAMALFVATVPEGLPIVATMALARGMWRMAERHALIERLAAVETLGSTDLILTDKTGTLTENRMTVARVETPDEQCERAALAGGSGSVHSLLETVALCNDATLTNAHERSAAESPSLGDPMEVALLLAAREAGIERDELLREWPEVRQDAFDPQNRMMATIHRQGNVYRHAVKGAPDAVLAACVRMAGEPLDPNARRHWAERVEALASQGYRVLCVATRSGTVATEASYADLGLLGLVALEDPPRPEVGATIAACRGAGVRLVMATGDQAATARSVARAVGLVDGEPVVVAAKALQRGGADVLSADVVARATPEDKLLLIARHQQRGSVVAMLGDGINDAPALRQADIGVALGQRGTQVAREAADMILLDDELSTVVMAIEQGRIIVDNIRKFVSYLLSCNLSEILVVTLASLIGAPLPLLPLQILFLNLVTDVFPALALTGGEGPEGIMQRPARPREQALVTGQNWLWLVGYGGLLTALTLTSLYLALDWLGFSEARAVTVSFLTLGFTQLAHVFNMADVSGSAWRNEVTRNASLWLALGLCSLLLIAAVHTPVLSSALGCVNPGFQGWGLVLVATLLTPVLGWVARRFVPRFRW